MSNEPVEVESDEWHKTACILCECNCGVEVRLGANGRSFDRIRGDKAHPASAGYTCEKALRLDHYQNGRAERLAAMRDARRATPMVAKQSSTADAARIGLTDGGTAKLTTKPASAVVTVAIDNGLQAGHITLPNGFGLDHVESGERLTTGVGTNEFTAMEDRDPWAGTPWHKSTPARLEPV